MLKRFEIFFLEVIYGKKRSVSAFFIRTILHFLSWVFALVSYFRNFTFDKSWCRRYYPPVLVISVGNIVAGGTGKTPVVLLLANQLSLQYSLAILSRGYRSPAERLSAPVALSRGEGPLYPSSYCGDEPYLLAQNLSRAAVFVGRDRQKASVLAVKWGAKVIVLDDGMQYRQLARDFEIVVVDACDPFGQGYFLPRGFLRERPQGLSRAQLIIANHVKDRAHYLTVKHKLSRYTQAPIVGTYPIISAIFDLKDNQIPSLKGKKVGMLCGIAKPNHFRELLQKEGAIIVEELIAPDHMSADRENFKEFIKKCEKSKAMFIVCTEKDKVKIKEGFSSSIPIVWVRMELQVMEGGVHWETFLEKVREKLNKEAIFN